MITTAKFEKTSATVKKIVDWAISSQAAGKLAEGSTTSIGTYRVVPKSTMPRKRGCLTLCDSDTIMGVEVIMPRPIHPNVSKEMLENAYKEGGSLAGAAKILGVSKKSVLNWMNKHGLDRKKPIDVDLLREMAQTMTTAEISKELGYDNSYINEVCRNNGFRTVDNFHKGYAVTHNGYLLASRNGNRKSGYMLIHRAVMEQHLGRKLNLNEVVHHINGDKRDNRIENLELMTRSDHARLHYWETMPSPHKRKV